MIRDIPILIDKLIFKFKYKKLHSSLSEKVRKLYKKYLPNNLKIDGDSKKLLYDLEGILISKGYDRIVIGDYGAYIEINEYQIQRKNLRVKKGEEYRIYDPNFKNHIKYYWYTSIGDSDIKIYYQIKKVIYADYIPGKYYISPYDIII